MFQKKANKGENLNEQIHQSSNKIWSHSVDSVHILHIFLGGVKMILVNIIFLTFTLGFCIKAGTILIPTVIEEFKNMED